MRTHFWNPNLVRFWIVYRCAVNLKKLTAGSSGIRSGCGCTLAVAVVPDERRGGMNTLQNAMEKALSEGLFQSAAI